jgi:hypothetical protein
MHIPRRCLCHLSPFGHNWNFSNLTVPHLASLMATCVAWGKLVVGHGVPKSGHVWKHWYLWMNLGNGCVNCLPRCREYSTIEETCDLLVKGGMVASLQPSPIHIFPLNPCTREEIRIRLGIKLWTLHGEWCGCRGMRPWHFSYLHSPIQIEKLQNHFSLGLQQGTCVWKWMRLPLFFWFRFNFSLIHQFEMIYVIDL